MKQSAERSRLSRRAFIQAGGAGLAVSTLGAAASAPAVAAVGRQWTQIADIVVVGSGAAASVAALAAAKDGAKVLMLEKAPVYGGTSAKSGGAFWVPNNFRLKERGIEDPKASLLAYCAAYSYPHLFDSNSPTLGLGEDVYKLLEAFYDNASPMTDMLREIKAAEIGRFHVLPDGQGTDLPDYGVLDGNNKVPRGRCLGPIKPDGSPGFGAELMRQIKARIDAYGIPLLTSHQVVRLVTDGDGAVLGVEALNDGKEVSFGARKGVIFATGGFTYNREMLNLHQTGPVYGGCGVPTNTGDFVSIAGAVGAKLGNMGSAWRAEIVLEEALEYVSVPSDVWIPPGDSMFIVNRYGNRVFNEKRNYHDRARVHQHYDPNGSVAKIGGSQR
ncbi:MULTISPECIES: FAD-dependent oxidoreductase [Sphingomonadales]|uniref:FAD-dependent oxidoreductase 2 FAD-binding domain-containing protein n=1 Tax=Sphingobium baderi LL03 TaxID=1114964 RepID=T0HLB6_9SPHN|nr:MULTISPECIES: FAD-dependent oxidoreductase [Sphingomonadaceae]AMK20790.1 putative flavoprotein [Sphingobium sp. MI1205]AMK26747.1 putative flavoprotein [Sphingobium sp. TKS]EQA98338.1 hypothetical protein L485_18235 [Sphingobium baderi LL03]KMS62267.1 fumarate reductase [Sphingobium baderi LL03]CAD7342177.1 3-oxosteroid 1-dehydrogenase [Sphingobium sp. S8]